MKHEIILFKQATLGRQYAHLVEHMLASRLSLAFSEHGCIPFLDYQFNAMTRDNIILLWFVTESDKALAAFNQVMKNADARILSDSEIINSLQRIAVEYGKLAKYDLKKIKANLAQLLKQNWQKYTDLTCSRPTNIDDWSFSADGLVFKNSKDFSNKLKSSIVKLAIHSPAAELKPLAYYVLLAANQIFENALYADTRLPEIFNSRFEWHEFPYEIDKTLVEFASEFSYFKGDWSIDKIIAETITNTQQKLLANLPKLELAIKQDIAAEDELDLLNRVFDCTGIMIGAVGWQNIITPENLAKLIKAVNFDIV
mgnify:CR=1 FL=1